MITVQTVGKKVSVAKDGKVLPEKEWLPTITEMLQNEHDYEGMHLLKALQARIKTK